MKRQLLVYAALCLAAFSMTACEVSSGGGYVGDGVYHDNGGYNGWDRDNDSSCCSSGGGSNSNDDRAEREREAHDRQTPNDTSDLHPPGVKPRDGANIMSLNNSQTSAFQSTDARVIKVADKYQISDYAATYIVRAIELAKANDESGITDLGLEKSDFAKVIKGKALSEEKMQALSSRLLMTPERAEKLLSDIKNDIKHAHE